GAALAFGLIVLGGVVRITGSGMGCGEHWPRCHGEWFPPLDLPTLIEIGHRWAAALVSLVVLALTVVAWVNHRDEPRLRTPATLASILLVVQVLLGAVTVKLALPPWVVITHLANAMALLAGETDRPVNVMDRHRIQKLAWATAGFGFLVILFGAQVANFGAGLLCLGLPLCNGTLLPPTAPLAALHWTHRVLAFLFLGLVLTLTTLVLRDRTAVRGVRRWTLVVAGVTVLQLGVGAVMVTRLLPAELRAAHLLVGTLLWATLVVLVFQANRIPTVASAPRKTHADKPSLLA